MRAVRREVHQQGQAAGARNDAPRPLYVRPVRYAAVPQPGRTRHPQAPGSWRAACGKTYSRADNLKKHMKVCTATGPSLVCDCGAALQTMDKFRAHQEGCVLSRPGASRAVKRRFSEIEDEDREAAALLAVADVTRWAQVRLAMTCAACGATFAKPANLTRHKRTAGH